MEGQKQGKEGRNKEREAAEKTFPETDFPKSETKKSAKIGNTLASQKQKGKVITMPEQEKTTTKAEQKDSAKTGFANVKMAAAFLTPHTFEAKDGRTFEKAYVKFPEGVKINGVDLGGYSCDVFMNDRMKQQMLKGEQVTLSFKADEPVAVWTGKKGDEQYPYKRFEVDPWDLAKAVKAEFDGYKEAKATERASLSQQAQDARESSAALEGKEVNEHAEPSR